MNDKIKNIAVTAVMALLLLTSALWCWLRPSDEFSFSERRALAQMPEISRETVLDGTFMTDFESYSMDQFPLREELRTLKAVTVVNLFRQLDNNGIYLSDGHLSKLDGGLQWDMLAHAASRFDYLYDTYLAGTDVNLYFAVIPDKNHYLAPEGGYPTLDHQALVRFFLDHDGSFSQNVDRYVDLTGLLSAEDYYTTDTHWRQEALLPVARALAEAMGTELSWEYEVCPLEEPFFGVYYGQSALSPPPDTICYLENPLLEECTVTSYATGSPEDASIYDMEAAAGPDPYEMFLCGTNPLVVVENPNAATQRELVIFRDSYAASLAPLLAEGYAKITLVDIRYFAPSILGNFVTFEDQDVLFLYSTTLLNNSLALR